MPAVAARHGLSAFAADALPTPSPELLREAQAQVTAGLKGKLLTLAVVDALSRAGVVPLLLKGYALAVRLYPGQELGRPSSDVDVLVDPSELDRCARALAGLGLGRAEDVTLEDPFHEHHHLSFSGPRGLVEVHFRLFTGFGGGAFDDAGVRERARDFTLDGRQVRVLSPEDEFLYLAVHAANHAFLRLSWLLDLERYLVCAPDLDWALMARRARAGGFHTAAASALAVLERLLEVSLSGAARRHFPSPPGRRRLEAALFSNARVVSAELSSHWLAAFGLRLLLVDSPAHGLRHLVDGARRYARRPRTVS